MIYEVADPDSQWWHTQWQWQAQQGQLWWQAQLAQSWWQGQTSPASGASSEWFSDDVVMVTAWRLHDTARLASHAMEGVEGLAKAKSLMDNIAWAAASESIAQPATNAMAAQALWDVDHDFHIIETAERRYQAVLAPISSSSSATSSKPCPAQRAI